MKEKTLAEIKDQMHRIETRMLNEKLYPKDRKRYEKWCELADAIGRNLLAYFGVEHLWEDGCYLRRNEPIPYSVRITR